MEKLMSPPSMGNDGRWADTVKKVCGADHRHPLDDAQLKQLTNFVIRQMHSNNVPPSSTHRLPLFNFNIPKKKRGSPATTTTKKPDDLSIVVRAENENENEQIKPYNVIPMKPAPKKPNLSIVPRVENENEKIKPYKTPKKRVRPDHHDHHDRKMKMKKMKKARRVEEEEVVTVLPLPGSFREVMMGMGVVDEDTIKFMVQKKVTCTDVRDKQNRLQIPLKAIKAGAGFLTREEERQVGSRNGMVVKIIEPSCEVCELRLRLWHMSGNGYYALISRHKLGDPHNKWYPLAMRNGIKKENRIQLWTFRVGADSKLGIAIVKC